ncbi:hypothetical protein TRFO_14249 [Tritrichomonas foetus]|uniref:Uncharacterized protein n=1 Tax=Tritrichomonas foetus TaxID=1144522 RepID=A0A1J4KVG4_9EUKA|nr:hypothetical protein TRFO_14249 [Tritrichomonas foetus]|eukprot:OHT15227.1 hypothetical protein TRFO_14249 [Tritrichomonas foetus]
MGRRSRNHTYVKFIILLDKTGNVNQRFELDCKGKLKHPLSNYDQTSSSGNQHLNFQTNMTMQQNQKLDYNPLPIPNIQKGINVQPSMLRIQGYSGKFIPNNSQKSIQNSIQNFKDIQNIHVPLFQKVAVSSAFNYSNESTPSSPPPSAAPVMRTSSFPITPMMRAKPSLALEIGVNNKSNLFIPSRAISFDEDIQNEFNVIDIRPQRNEALQAF